MKSVLVTGGTGFFGRSFVSRLLSSGSCDRICVYSRSESAQAEMRDSISDKDRTKVRFFIGDVRDRDRLRRAMDGVDTVVHAAALKRIEVGMYNPIEMVKTNVGGSVNVIEAAQDAHVGAVVYLSTDKAFRPISPYGLSKAMAESLFLDANNTVRHTGPFFSVTRYGNVFNSTGSVVPRWNAMIESGKEEVPVTDPDCTRFFMRDSEAVDLVLQAIRGVEKGLSGDLWQTILIPQLPAFRLGDLAEAMGVGMRIVGLPEYEKKHESMSEGISSDMVRRMSVNEIRYELDRIKQK